MTDEELLPRFEDTSLPYEEWTHRAHVRVAFLYLRDRSFEEAVESMRAGIRRFNAAKDVPEGPASGYNETTTVAFLQLVEATLSAYGELLPDRDSETFCDHHPQLMTKHVLRLFYSPEQRMHPDAKSTFVEPDLAPLPKSTRDNTTTESP